MKVMKFGGSSVATPERIRSVAEILKEARSLGEVAVVVSALGGVTDELIATAKTAAAGDAAYTEALDRLESRHLEAARELAEPAEREVLESGISTELGDLRDLLHGTYLVREASPRTLDRVTSYGERQKLCYLAVLAGDAARVSLEAVGLEHPAASLQGTDNLVAIYTDRYREAPLVIRGPGAGPEVTAAGVFGDVLRAARES